MSNREIMKKHLLSYVVSPLLADGFTGRFPHYRRIGQDCVELVTFQWNKYGGSFTVEVSAVFPNYKDTNCASESIDVCSVNVWETNRRYRLKGMYGGWFYHCDLYAKRIIGFGKGYLTVSEKQKSDFVVPKGYKLVQKFDEETAQKVCDAVNLQLKTAFRWLEKFKKHMRYTH